MIVTFICYVHIFLSSSVAVILFFYLLVVPGIDQGPRAC